jgi:hypothetical protein
MSPAGCQHVNRGRAARQKSRAFPNTSFSDLVLENGLRLVIADNDPTGSLVMSVLIRFLRNESGATAIEYGLIAAGISIAIITF